MKHKIKFICRQIVAYVCVIALLVTQNTVLVLSADENGGKINLELGSDYQQKLRPFMTYNGSNVGIASFNYTLNHIENGDNVKFFAKATFSSKEAKEYENVQLSDFYISPEFADKYNLNIPETENNTIVVDHGTILKKQIICIPNNNVHYKGQLSTVDIQGCTFEGVVEGEEIKLAEGLQWRVGYSGGEYYYKVLYKASDGSNIDVTDNIPTNSENYIVTATEPVVKDKPVVSASVKLAAQGDNNKINYVQDKGIVANSSVIVSVSSEDDSDINGMTFTLYSDETKLAGPLAAVKNSDGKYVADFTLELSDKEGCYSREIKDLKYTINGMQKPENLSVSLNGKSSNTVILDKDAPVQASDNPVSLNYDNAQKTVTVKGGFEDNLSGVKKIEYEIEGKKESVVVNDSSFEHTYEYSDLNDSDCDGQYGIELKVTDNAENTLSITDSDGDGGIDITPPKIGEIKLSAVKDNTELELKEVLKNSDSGNYSKETLKLEITAEDDAEFKEIAAISKVMLLDGEAIKYEQQGDMKGYVFYLENDVIGDLKVKLLDVQGNESELYSLKELLAEYEKESDINWNELKTNAWIVDKANPEISVYYHGVVQKNNQYYYNLNGGAFEIRVKEKNGLSKFTVKQEYNGASVDIYPSRIDEDDDGIFTCSVDVNSLSTGWYNYTVKAVDNAGRFDERYYTFYVDKETPSGEIQAFVLEDNVRTDVSVIDNENWMTEKDQNGNNRFITFRMYIESYGSDVESVNFVINGDTRHPVTATLDGSEINGYSDGLFTVLHNKLSVEDTTNRKYIDLVLDTSKWTSEQKATCGNTFNISANVKAISQNTSKEILYDLHIDTEKPEINQIVVSKKNTSLENIVNILSFGAFFNDTILISVKATDGDNDAGISKVTLKHDYLTEEAEMVFDEDSQMYTCDLEIPAGESIFKSNITVKVYDKMGNCTTDFPNDNNVQGSGNVPNNYFVMIEQNPPTATIELPTGDNRNVVYKSNGEVWLNATDQKICVSVNDQGEENSGIREVVVEVDVKDKDGQIIKSEKIKVDKNGNELLTAEVTKDKDEKISEVSYEFSSNDIAAMCGKPGNESYTVKCKVVDNAGNVGYADEKVFYRDVTDPAVTMFEFTPKSENGVESTTELTTEVDSNQLEYGYFFKNPSETGEVKLTATVNDTVNENGNAVLSSGFRKVVFRLVSTENGVEETKQVDNQIDNNKAECIIPANFKGKIYVEVLDMVGNKSEEKTSKAFILDEDKPVIKIEPLPDNKAKLDDMGNKLYTRNADTVDSVENVEFDVTISDKKSGLSEVSYTKSSDLNSLKAVLTETIDYKSTDYTVGTELEHGWIITEMEANLVTEISKTFTFDELTKISSKEIQEISIACSKGERTEFTTDSPLIIT
ncbi:MAG: hypothetical protein UD936_04705, partial [Acutalibacteraceae bacterium]|nr:hypothetical protein [Acutalibacteraceae bacterium]